MCTHVIPIAELRTACPCCSSQCPEKGPFHHADVDSSQSHHPTVRVRTGSNRNKVSILFLRFFVCDFQQRFNPQEELSNTRKKLLSYKRTCIVFSKAYEKDSKSSQMPLTRAKVERGSNLSKDNFFSHCCKDIRELSNGQICSCSRFEQNGKYAFCIKNVDLRSFQQKKPVVFRLWSRLCYSDCERSRARIEKKLPRSFSASLELVVPKGRIFEQPFGLNLISFSSCKDTLKRRKWV